MTKIVIRFTFVEIYLLFWFMRKLFAWIGITDLKAAGVIPLGEGEKDPGLGPIANLLSEWADRYDSVYLISNQGYTGFQAYQDWLLKKTGKDVVGCLCALEGGDVTNHALIHAEVKRVLDKYGKTGELSFHISPGTPAMATIWVIMATSFYPATLVETDRNSGPRIVNFPFDVQARWVGEEAERQAQDLAITLVKEGAQKLSSLSDGATEENFAFKDMIYRCSAMVRVVERSKRVAVRDVPVLILGETGTGKELLANAIHMESLRSKNKFVEVNCGAIPSELVESEFFGHKKGAFTGALSNKDRQGHFEVANGGTLFLDEIGELPLNVQVKLLRVLQEKEVTPVGASESIKVDIRIIAATHRDLAEMVREGRFREDLYHRLAIGVITLPPLRQREDDVSLLVDSLLAKVNMEASGIPAYIEKKLSHEAKLALLRHSWPGNIRELWNCLLRVSIWVETEVIQENDVLEALENTVQRKEISILDEPLGNGFDVKSVLNRVKAIYIEKALAESGGRRGKAAELLGLGSHQLLKKWCEDAGIALD